MPVHQASATHHPCCPSLKSNTVLEASPLAAPCGRQHRCCFSQGPVVPSGLPVSSERGFVRKTISPVDGARVFLVSAKDFAGVDASFQYSALSMVLRI